MKTNMNVYKTDDYSIFKMVKGNRKINELHVERLKKSMKEEYLISPIIVNEEHQIIDGQHRFHAIRELGENVYYIVCEGYGLDEIHRLNEINQTWNKQDFLNGYADKGLEEYIKTKDFMKKHEITSVALAIELLNNNLSQKSLSKKFENGNFKIETMDLADNIMNKIKDFDSYFGSARTSLFIKAFKKLYNHPNYKHKKMVNKLESDGHKMDTRASMAQYLDLLLNDIYNPNLISKNKIYVVEGTTKLLTE